jgi:phospholipase C
MEFGAMKGCASVRKFAWLALLPACSGRSTADVPDDAAPGDTACVSRGDLAASRAACEFAANASPSDTLGPCATGARIPIEHIVLLMQENRSFDHYLGHLKGNGQEDIDAPPDDAFNPGVPDAPEAGAAGDGANPGAPVRWHHLSDDCFDDTNHEWGPSHLEWNQGKNDGFVAENAGPNDPLGFDRGGERAMGYYDAGDIPFYYALASTFAISDRYFSDVMGPTFPNRRYFYSGSSSGYTSNDLDAIDYPTIFGALNERGVSWKVYKSDLPGGAMFHSFGKDAAGRVVDIAEFAKDAAQGTLPQVAWVDPLFILKASGQTSEHPPADMQVGQQFVFEQVTALLSSPNWPTSAMFITFDEHGGLYDHVAPPAACPPDDTPPREPGFGGFDRYGFRVPVFVVSPYSKGHFVSHAVHSHSSILRFVEAKFDLSAFSKRDANADAMLDMFDFAHPTFVTPPPLIAPPVDEVKLEACVARYGP